MLNSRKPEADQQRQSARVRRHLAADRHRDGVRRPAPRDEAAAAAASPGAAARRGATPASSRSDGQRRYRIRSLVPTLRKSASAPRQIGGERRRRHLDHRADRHRRDVDAGVAQRSAAASIGGAGAAQFARRRSRTGTGCAAGRAPAARSSARICVREARDGDAEAQPAAMRGTRDGGRPASGSSPTSKVRMVTAPGVARSACAGRSRTALFVAARGRPAREQVLRSEQADALGAAREDVAQLVGPARGWRRGGSRRRRACEPAGERAGDAAARDGVGAARPLRRRQSARPASDRRRLAGRAVERPMAPAGMRRGRLVQADDRRAPERARQDRRVVGRGCRRRSRAADARPVQLRGERRRELVGDEDARPSSSAQHEVAQRRRRRAGCMRRRPTTSATSPCARAGTGRSAARSTAELVERARSAHSALTRSSRMISPRAVEQQRVVEHQQLRVEQRGDARRRRVARARAGSPRAARASARGLGQALTLALDAARRGTRIADTCRALRDDHGAARPRCPGETPMPFRRSCVLAESASTSAHSASTASRLVGAVGAYRDASCRAPRPAAAGP